MSILRGNPEQLDRRVGRSAFGGDASGYHEARSGYPQSLFDNLKKRAATSPRVLEIGAGTGLASGGLLRCAPSQLTLVEPDPRLCAFLEGRFAGGGVKVICGTFPETQVDGQFDLVACAAAFHWMEPEPALARIKSLLAPDGIWAMWWNCYFGHGVADPFAEQMAQVLVEEGVTLPPSYQGSSHYALDADLHTVTLSDAGFRDVEHLIIHTSRTYDVEQAQDLYRSFSFINLLPDAVQARIFDRLADAIRSDFSGLASGVVVTSAFVGTI